MRQPTSKQSRSTHPLLNSLPPGTVHGIWPNGWSNAGDRIVPVLQHSVNVGQYELLTGADFLRDWLTAERKSLI